MAMVKDNRGDAEKPRTEAPKKRGRPRKSESIPGSGTPHSVHLNMDYDMWRVPEAIRKSHPGWSFVWAERVPHRVQQLLHQGAKVMPGYEESLAHEPSAIARTPDSLAPAPPGHILMGFPPEYAAARKEYRARKAKEQEQTLMDRKRDLEEISKRYGRKAKVELWSDTAEAEKELFDID